MAVCLFEARPTEVQDEKQQPAKTLICAFPEQWNNVWVFRFDGKRGSAVAAFASLIPSARSPAFQVSSVLSAALLRRAARSVCLLDGQCRDTTRPTFVPLLVLVESRPVFFSARWCHSPVWRRSSVAPRVAKSPNPAHVEMKSAAQTLKSLAGDEPGKIK